MQSDRKNRGQWSVASGRLTDAKSASRVPNPQPPTSNPQPRRGFTLTELLVVIAIIAVLAAMVSVAVMRALDTAKQTRIKTEVDQLDAAFKAYREKYGSFPPCSHDFARIQQHIARAFPRYDISRLSVDMQAAGYTGRLRPDEALVFWLGGFSPDPANPFVTPGPDSTNPTAPVRGAKITVGGMVLTPTVKEATPLFDFDPTRLAVVLHPAGPAPTIVNNNGHIPSYFPQGVKADATGAPYIYWDSEFYPQLPLVPGSLMWNVAPPPNFNGVIFANAGGIRPYAFDVNNDNLRNVSEGWANPDSFQIISAGLDGKYGALGAQRTDPPRLFPTGQNSPPTASPPEIAISYDPLGADDDNVTNFSAKARLGDAKP